TATVTAYDATRTYAQSFEITVADAAPVQIAETDTYVVNADDYSIRLDAADSAATTNGIQAALDYAAAHGYKQIVFPRGSYLISPAVRTIYPPSNMTIDFNDSTLQIEPSKLTATGYVMFFFRHLSNTTLTRTHLYG